MDAEYLLGSLLRGAVGSRRTRRTAASLLSNPQMLVGIAGAAWGIYEAWKSNQGANQGANQGTAAAPSLSSAPAPPPLPAEAVAAAPPPLATGTASAGIDTETVRAIRLTLAAAKADGQLSAVEAEMILAEARKAGAEDLVFKEMESAHSLAEIVSGLEDPQRKSQLYLMAFLLCQKDQGVSDRERIFLAQLAQALALEARAVELLEQQAQAAMKG